MTKSPWWTGLGTIAVAGLLPGAGFIMAFFMPGIVVAQCADVGRERLGLFWPSLFCLTLTLGLFFGGAFLIGFEISLFAWALFWAKEKELEIPQVLIWVTSLFAFFYLVLFLYWHLVSGVESGTIVEEIRRAMGKGLSPYGLEEEQFKRIVDSLVEVIPFLISLSVIGITYCNILVANFWKRRISKDKAPIFRPGFELFRLPDGLVWVGIIGGAGSLFAHGASEIASRNVLFTILALYCIQGAGVLKYFMNRYAINWMIQLAVFLLLISSWYGLIAITIVGVADVWMDVRKRQSKAQNSSYGNV